jgi:hypothetical protein
MEADAPMCPHWQTDFRLEALEENEGGLIPNPATRLVPLRD